MQRFIKLSACVLTFAAMSLSTSSSEAGGKWWGNCHGPSCHNFNWKPYYYGYRPYYRPYPVVVQQPVYTQPVYTQPVVVQAPPTTSIEVATNLTQVPVGTTITLSGQGFGSKPGTVGVAAGDLMLAAEVTNWTNESVSVKVPQLTLAGPSKAKIIIFRANQTIADEVPCELVASAN